MSQIFGNINEILERTASVLPTVANKPNESIELEVRFGNFGPNSSFQSGISQQSFVRVRNFLRQKGAQAEYVHSRDRLYPQQVLGRAVERTVSNSRKRKDPTVRFTTILNEDGSPQDTYQLVKDRKSDFDYPDYGTRISISSETIIRAPEPTGVSPIHIREKKRWTFYLGNVANNNAVKIDLTEVTAIQTQVNDPKQNKTVYELEIEVLNPVLTNFRGFPAVVDLILKQLLETRLLYPFSEKLGVITRVNSYLSANNYQGEIDNSAFTQVRNLKRKDLAAGEILPTANKGVYYSVTIKADGVRKFLVIDTQGIYLVASPSTVNKLLDSSVLSNIGDWIGTVIEGEYLTPNDLSETGKLKADLVSTPYHFLMYDILSVARNTQVQNLTHPDRLKYVQKIEEMFVGVKGMNFRVKPFDVFQSREEFYAKVNNLLDQEYDYNRDGLIFTPSNYQYQTGLNGKVNLKTRKLSQNPDILKWKPLEFLTIDLRIRREMSEDGPVLQLYTINEPFTGSFKWAFDPKNQIDTTAYIPNTQNNLENLPDNTIVEFAFNTDSKKLTPLRIRDEKPFPNRKAVAMDVWDDIHEPIEEGIIRGTTFGLLRRYHNSIKRKLFSEIGQLLPRVDGLNIKARTLLDIGSGKGGDIDKWIAAGFTHVICVEPNEENRKELIRRVSSKNLTVHILPTIGQDVDTIYRAVQEFAPNKRVDAISYMLSLSFFFSDNTSPLKIIQLASAVLAPGGFLAAFTIDGRYVLEYFSNPGNFTEVNGSRVANFELLTMKLSGNPLEVFIDIPGTIVQNQTEWLTNLPGLLQVFKDQQFKLLKEERAAQEQFLTNDEYLYTAMFTSFLLQRPFTHL